MNSLSKTILIIVGVLVSVWSSLRILNGGFFDYVMIMPILGVLMLSMMLSLRSYWPCILAASTMLPYTIPVPLFDRLGLFSIVAVILLALRVTRSAISKEPPLRKNAFHWSDWLFFTLACLITLRFLSNPPGSARLGESGGLSVAIAYLIGGWLVFALDGIKIDVNRYRKSIIAVLIISIVMWIKLLSKQSTGGFYFGSLYHRPTWMLAGVLLALVMNDIQNNKRTTIKYYITSAFILLLSIFAFHRVRPLLALLQIFTTSLMYGRAKSITTKIIIIFAAVITLATTFFYNELPAGAKRTLSGVFPALSSKAKEYGVQGELGWEMGFRDVMYLKGIENMKSHPLTGVGYEWSRNDILGILWASKTAEADWGEMGALALSGGYHNSLFALGVFNGLPAMLICGLAYIGIFLRSYRYVKSLPFGAEKIWGTAISSYLIAYAGHALVNGGGGEFIVCSACVAVLRQLIQQGDNQGGAGS